MDHERLLVTNSTKKESKDYYKVDNPILKYVLFLFLFVFCFIGTLLSVMFYFLNSVMGDAKNIEN